MHLQFCTHPRNGDFSRAWFTFDEVWHGNASLFVLLVLFEGGHLCHLSIILLNPVELHMKQQYKSGKSISNRSEKNIYWQHSKWQNMTIHLFYIGPRSPGFNTADWHTFMTVFGMVEFDELLSLHMIPSNTTYLCIINMYARYCTYVRTTYVHISRCTEFCALCEHLLCSFLPVCFIYFSHSNNSVRFVRGFHTYSIYIYNGFEVIRRIARALCALCWRVLLSVYAVRSAAFCVHLSGLWMLRRRRGHAKLNINTNDAQCWNHKDERPITLNRRRKKHRTHQNRNGKPLPSNPNRNYYSARVAEDVRRDRRWWR